MGTWHRLRNTLRQLPRWALLLAGLYILYHYGVTAFGGRDKVWLFEKSHAHRFTAMAMLTGTLRLHSGLSMLAHDEQAYNGAVYTNWGFGVPLLQLPFHAVAKMGSWPQKFFPDRAICFSYFMAMVPLLWAAFHRLLAMREPHGSRAQRHFLSWAATAFVLSSVFYPLMASRFLVYEDTVCYFEIAEILALAAYVFALRSWSSWAVVGLGVAAGVGLLVRPTGLIYLGMWTLLLLLERRTRRTLLAFASSTAPFVVFWMVSNWVRTGSSVGLGLNNSMPWFDYHTPMVRFGALCSDTPAHAWQVAERLFTSFFSIVNVDMKPWPWLDKCHFKLEPRVVPGESGSLHEPFFGVAVLVALVWMVLHKLGRRESRLALYVPAATLALLFGTYVWAGTGFAWRYVGDFWPAIVLAGVQYVRFLPRGRRSPLGLPLALTFAACSWATFDRHIELAAGAQDTANAQDMESMWNEFSKSRWEQDKTLPTHVKCGDKADWLWHDGQGWKDQCKVDTFTNLFIGVPYKRDDNYRLELKTEGIESPTLRVYLNGRIYTARRSGDGYVADVTIRYDRLTTPIVMTTIEWTRDFEPPSGRFLSMDLS